MKLTRAHPLADKLIRQGRLTPEDFAPRARQLGAEARSVEPTASEPSGTRPRPPNKSKRGVMNKTEARFAAKLDSHRIAYIYEPITVKLAPRLTYTPDFLVIPMVSKTHVGLIFYEVKAWWSKAGRVGWAEDSRVKLKIAAKMFPMWEFRATWEKDGVWEEELFRAE